MASYILKCQEDSYVQSLSRVSVLECRRHVPSTKWPVSIIKDYKNLFDSHFSGTKSDLILYEVELSQTVIFPEGGGQPFDKGKIVDDSNTEVTIFAAMRNDEDGRTWHLINKKLDENTVVSIYLDWKRRLDHMQCHSAQHLLSAIADTEFKLSTVSWCLKPMGPSQDEPCYVDLSGLKTLEPKDLQILEDRVNEQIKNNHKIISKVYSSDEFKSLENIRLKALPNSNFPIRVIEIEGIDINTCCGTHVKSTCEIQLFKILKVLKLKPILPDHENSIRLFFVAGVRAQKMLSNYCNIFKDLNKHLSCNKEEAPDRVQLLVNSQKSFTKFQKTVFKDYAQLLGPYLVTNVSTRLLSYHYSEGTPSFQNFLLKSIESFCQKEKSNNKINHPMLIFLTVGDEKTLNGNGGAFMLVAHQEISYLIQEGLKILNETMSVKGVAKGLKAQGKIPQKSLIQENIDRTCKLLNSLCEKVSEKL